MRWEDEVTRAGAWQSHQDPAVGDTSDERRANGRSYYLFWGLGAMACSDRGGIGRTERWRVLWLRTPSLSAADLHICHGDRDLFVHVPREEPLGRPIVRGLSSHDPGVWPSCVGPLTSSWSSGCRGDRSPDLLHAPDRQIGTVNASKCPDLGFRCFRGTDMTIPWRPPRTNTPVGLAERTYPLGESTCTARGEDLCASGRASAGS